MRPFEIKFHMDIDTYAYHRERLESQKTLMESKLAQSGWNM